MNKWLFKYLRALAYVISITLIILIAIVTPVYLSTINNIIAIVYCIIIIPIVWVAIEYFIEKRLPEPKRYFNE